MGQIYKTWSSWSRCFIDNIISTRLATDYTVVYLYCLTLRYRISQIIAPEVPLLVDGESISVIIILCITLFIPPNVAPHMFIFRFKPYCSAGCAWPATTSTQEASTKPMTYCSISRRCHVAHCFPEHVGIDKGTIVARLKGSEMERHTRGGRCLGLCICILFWIKDVGCKYGVCLFFLSLFSFEGMCTCFFFYVYMLDFFSSGGICTCLYF